MTRHYLSECSKEELKEMILYPADLWNTLYNVQADLNNKYACDVIKWVLKDKDYGEWVKIDRTSYDWFINIKEGHYRKMLDLDLDYMSDEDAKEIKEKQQELQKLVDKIDNLENDDYYYDNLYSLENDADEVANEILQIVRQEIKRIEEVTDEQLLETFELNNMGDNYYYLDNDKSVIYEDITKSYKTNIKKGQ